MRPKNGFLLSVVAGRFVITVVAGALGLLALSAGGARADTISSLPITSFYQIVADTSQGYLFLSSPGQNSIFVTNLTGGEIDQISGLNGVEGMALSADGSTLYAALSSADAVDAISVSSFHVTASYPLPTGDMPWNVAVQSDAVWVGYETSSAGSSGIGDIDLSVSSPAFTAQPGMGTWYSAPQLAADPADGGVLVAVQPGQSSAQAATYSTSSSPATFTQTASTTSLGGVDGCENEEDLAVVPGGAQFLVACADPSAVNSYTMADLGAPANSYSGPATADHPVAVALAQNGTVAAGVGGAAATDLFAYQSGQSTPTASYGVSGSDMTIAARGFAWSADNSQLFVVIQFSSNGSTSYALRVLYPPLTSSVLSLGFDAFDTTTLYGAPVFVTGELSIGPNGSTQPGANDTVTITRTPVGSSTPTATYTVTTDSGGGFTQPDTASPPLPLGSYTYAASYAGDSATAPATTSQVVTIVPDVSNITLAGPSTAVTGQDVSLDGTLSLSGGVSLPAGTDVTITRTLVGSTATPESTTVPVAADGGFTLTDIPTAPGTYTYTAGYAGASTAQPSTSPAVTVTVAQVASNLSLGGTSTAVVGKSISVTGTLALSVGTPAAGTPITITRTLAGSTATARYTVSTKAGGGFTLTNTPPARGTYTYTASYAGNAITQATTATHKVTIAGLPATLTVTTGATTFNYASKITVTAHLGSTYTDRTVSIYAQWLGWKTRTLLKTGRVNSAGILTVSYVAPHSTVFSVVFAGDARYSPRTVTHTVGVRANVTLTIGGYYTSKRVGGTTYRVYHHTELLRAAVAVAPNKHGQCVEIQVQQFYKNKWHSNLTTGCGDLNSSSKVSGSFNLTEATGGTYRMRAYYIRSSTDTSNVSAYSPWAYFTVVT
jgi:hypothetical protein